MKKQLIVYLACLTALPMVAQTATAKKTTGAQSGGGAAAAIEKADKDRTAAIVKADVDALDKATGDGYVFTDSTGRVTSKKELMDDFKAGKIKIESQDVSDMKVHAYGNTAVETGKLVSKGTRDGQDAGGTFRFTRVWVNHNGTWQTVAFQETKAQ